MGTYVCCCEFLLRADYGAAALGGVQGGFAFDCCFALRGSGAADAFADFRDLVPVAHRGGVGVVVGWWELEGVSGMRAVVKR